MRGWKADEIALFLYCVAGFVFVDLGAAVYPVELVAIAACVHVWLLRSRGAYGETRDIYESAMPRLLLFGLLLWFFATLLSDLVNQTAPTDLGKGVARVVATAALLVAILFFVNGSAHRVRVLWYGLAAGQLLGLVVQPGSYFIGEPWKFGFSVPVTVIGFLLASGALSRGAIGISLALCAINFAMGTRSLAVICLVVALVLIVRHRRVRRGGGLRLAFALAAGLVGVLLLVETFDYLALNGAFGVQARARAQYQSEGELGALLTGRGELFFSLRSIAEYPWLGVGSYGEPSREVIVAQSTLLSSEGYSAVAGRYLEEGLASFHSELFGAVAENGLLAAVFWCAVGIVFLRGLGDVVSARAQQPALLAFLCALGLWDLLFSPFGADRKFWLAASLVTALTLRLGRTGDHRSKID